MIFIIIYYHNFIIIILLEFKKQFASLRSQKSQFSDQKIFRITIESKLEVVNYLQFVYCTQDTTKQNEEI